ncbi:hypothetical protein [Hymenobacter sp. AT01-02]|uniref:hypothetical protein n=1 Tax=Hymenobacter sp. AT01-02 TaxID=1571877 RepID=UPI000B15788B|nr:hypothetical protein [Hymenobacter sp. AT01-02]
MRLTSRFLTGLLSVVALVSGCQVTAPRELPPVVATPTVYAGNPTTPDTASISDLPWQTFFADSASWGLLIRPWLKI